MARFVLVGGANTAISYVIYLVLLSYIDYRVAYGIAYLAGLGIGYLANARIVFRAGTRVSTAVAYGILYLVLLAGSTLLLYILVERLKLPRQLAALVVIVIATPVSYVAQAVLFRGGRDQR